MKKITLIALFTLISSTLFGQDITGQWNGILTVPGGQLPLIIHVSKTDTGYTATMDSPDQKAFGMPLTTTTFENGVMKFSFPAAAMAYEGSLKDHKFSGNFTQSGQTFALDFTREKVEKTALVRPQEPKKPYPYYSEDVVFANTKSGNTLSGTLTLPTKEGSFPVVVLISGSGAQNRDEALLGHKPFLVLADFLTRNGIGVLRYDDRGTGESTGNYATATTLNLATDTEAAVNYLLTRKEINKKKIGLMGHSEGGVIAPMVASQSKNISFIVLLAGTGLRGDQLLLLQQELIAKAYGANEETLQKNKAMNAKMLNMVLTSANDEKLTADLTAYCKKYIAETTDKSFMDGMTEDEFITEQLNAYTTPWMKYFIRLDPAVALEKTSCPVLAINGSKDLQVPPKENLSAIKTALTKGGNKAVTTKELPNLNHLFQECSTGSPQEYATIEQTLSPLAMNEILGWLQLKLK